MSDEQRLIELENWIAELEHFNARLSFSSIERKEPQWLVAVITTPYEGTLAFRFVEAWERAAEISVTPPPGADVVVLMHAEVLSEGASPAVARIGDTAGELWLSPEWTAAIVVQHAKPVYAGWQMQDATPLPYLEQPRAGGAVVGLKRAANRMRRMLGGALIDPGVLEQRIAALEAEQVHHGSILLCTMFLPSVFESLTAVKRYYTTFTTDADAASLIERKIDVHRAKWREHVSKHQRVDIIDRGQLEEYLAAPDYYQMRLTSDEAREQIDVIAELLASPNYELCLTPEAVDLPYEVRGSEVHVRSDRRNKGKSRAGKVDGLVLRDPGTVESFKREFWSTYELIEPQFKDKMFIVEWLRRRCLLSLPPRSYDIAFYGEETPAEVPKLAEILEAAGAKCWLPDRDGVPGLPWFEALECTATFTMLVVLNGSERLMPWRDRRMQLLVERVAATGVRIVVFRGASSDDDHALPAIADALMLPYTSADDAASRLKALLSDAGAAEQYRLPKPTGTEVAGLFLR